MITIGIDLASQPKKTAACVLKWNTSDATVERLALDINDETLLELADMGDKVGIDVPFGWPETFVRAVSAHHSLQPWPFAESVS